MRATDYIETRFGDRFKGLPEADDQALSFPRTAFDGIPTLLKKATAEYALRALTSDLMPDPEQAANGRSVVREFSKVGPIEEEVEYQESPGFRITKAYPAADKLIKRLLRPVDYLLRA